MPRPILTFEFLALLATTLIQNDRNFFFLHNKIELNQFNLPSRTKIALFVRVNQIIEAKHCKTFH